MAALDQITNATTLDQIVAVGLLRQSRKGDTRSMSLPDQEAAFRNFCAVRGWVPGPVYTEPDVSGTLPVAKRRGLRSCIEDIEAGRAQVLVSVYFDRFSRNPEAKDESVDRIEAVGGFVHAMDFGDVSNKTAQQWLNSHTASANGKAYAMMVGEKVAPSKQRNIDNGKPPFPRVTPAYQRRADGTLELHPTNAPLIREAIAMRLADPPASIEKVTRWLNAQGVRNERGLPLTFRGVESMFASKLLMGEIHFGKFTPNLNAGALWGGVLIDRATFRALQKPKGVRGRKAKSVRLLARLRVLRCGVCDSPMVLGSTTSTSGKLYPYYKCSDKMCEQRVSIGAQIAEDHLKAEAVRLSKAMKGRASAKSELAAARAALDGAQTELNNAIRSLLRLGDEAATSDVLDELQANRDRAKAEHDRLAAVITPDLTVTTPNDADSLTFDGWRVLIRNTIRAAVVAPGRGGIERITCHPYPLSK